MLVFVYGTLRKGAENDAELFVGAQYVDSTAISGRLYNLGWYPGIKLGEVGSVVGDLFRVTAEQLDRLDAYEGAPHLYSRRRLSTLPGDEPTYVYEYNGQVHPNDEIPGGDWLERQEGVVA